MAPVFTRRDNSHPQMAWHELQERIEKITGECALRASQGGPDRRSIHGTLIVSLRPDMCESARTLDGAAL